MKKIVIAKESLPQETRIAITPDLVQKYVHLGFEVYVESSLGKHLAYEDQDFQDVGAKIFTDKPSILKQGDIHLRVNTSSLEEILLMKKGAIHISFYDAYQDAPSTELFLKQGITAISLQMIPRTTLAQKMDALSSQASIAGYAAVLLAANHHSTLLPMMTTPAGTIRPASVFVIGVGVAGLQAIATAKRLGAKVSAFDTRPVVEEQVKSLGAKFIKVDLGETAETKNGYAVALTEKQLEKQRQEMARVAATSDIIITTAALVGRKAPIILTKDLLSQMKKAPQPVIVDMAVESGGNVEGSALGETVDIHGVKVIGPQNLPGFFAHDATAMYSRNLYELLAHFCKEKSFFLSLDDPILSSSVVTHAGDIIHNTISELQGVS